jgi:Dihaem cytochrome c
MTNSLENHFDADASLGSKPTAEIMCYLLANELMWRIASGNYMNDAPLRFTETAYFEHVHDEVPGSMWKRSMGSEANCIARHTKFDTGSFSEREIRIPKD